MFQSFFALVVFFFSLHFDIVSWKNSTMFGLLLASDCLYSVSSILPKPIVQVVKAHIRISYIYDTTKDRFIREILNLYNYRHYLLLSIVNPHITFC